MNFFGGKLVQRREHCGKLVEFAGHILLENGHWLASRIKNPHVTYTFGEPDVWNLKNMRFASGAEYLERSSQLGQVFGHINSVLDHSNRYSLRFTFFDIFWLFLELKLSGWSSHVFLQSLKRLRICSPGVTSCIETFIDLVECLVNE